MPTLLRLDASAAAADSTSRSLTAAFAAAFAASPGNAVVNRDLHADPVPHLPHPQLHWAAPLRNGSAPDPANEARQEALIVELLAADVLVIGYPLYNYSLPSSLKAWIDHVHVPGRTAAAAGSGSPLAGRPAVLVVTRGGDYGPGALNEGRDLATPVLELVLGEEMGMDVSVVACQWTLAGNGSDREARLRRGERERAAALEAVRVLGSRLN
ncbi:FMN-dependent NADH-azoreductase [Glycomyces tritici]|uniref:FMN dependent NADH:quinone oxidoreductase n=1 Tax=Glycomyces tritici TaxID=2665176 RepID=A0ABT7YN18_9ACTN|nr:NAD(P)H-dependent oxidoreductase [Glycomyces tritici]MDN3240039.1 NAD(P)H-dependent oxidoreductase [Glycomyces tritici]